MRVASVLPSATEILCFIGGERLLVGRSHEDNFPPQITSLPVITGQTTTFTTAAEVDRVVSDSIGKGQSLYTLDAPLIESLSPDVILTQDICSVCAIDLQTVERLAAKMTPRPKVVSLNPLNLDDVLANVLQLGEAVGMAEEARAAHASLVERIAAVDRRVEQRRRQLGEGRRRPRVAFIEWSDPLYVGGHWTPQLIERAGGEHPLNAGGESGGGKSFPVPPSAVVEADPDLVILAPCGLTLDMTRREATALARTEWWRSLRAVREGRVVLVDGDAMFNRPGPRLVDALEWLFSAVHGVPEAAPHRFPCEWLPPSSSLPRDEASAAAGGSPEEEAAAEQKAIADIEEAHACAVRAGKRSRCETPDPHTAPVGTRSCCTPVPVA
uniref:Fe/B12 periplasmic-binding domain-containing protein n=1 Tax=Emiliania huxleyi TaxID=2903 RepID=A0A7S3TLT5_EMIHU